MDVSVWLALFSEKFAAPFFIGRVTSEGHAAPPPPSPALAGQIPATVKAPLTAYGHMSVGVVAGRALRRGALEIDMVLSFPTVGVSREPSWYMKKSVVFFD